MKRRDALKNIGFVSSLAFIGLAPNKVKGTKSHDELNNYELLINNSDTKAKINLTQLTTRGSYDINNITIIDDKHFSVRGSSKDCVNISEIFLSGEIVNFKARIDDDLFEDKFFITSIDIFDPSDIEVEFIKMLIFPLYRNGL